MTDHNTLLAAIHALEPFSNSFCTTNPTEHAVQCEPFLLVCDYCDAESHPADKIKHTPECPVTHLRNILKEARKPDATEIDYGLEPLKQEGKCADPLMFCGISASYLKIDPRGVFDGVDIEDLSLELHTEDVITIKNVSDKDMVIPLSSPALATIEAQNKTNETILKDIFRECRSRAEMGECPEPKYIKSPTDNGV
jgi:hypothetical protein